MYFELDDIRRRHNLYWDTGNTGGWVRAPDVSISWNYERGAIIGVSAMLINETLKTYSNSVLAILNKYEPPSNFKQASIIAKEAYKLDFFKQNMRVRVPYAVCMGLTDIASRVSAYRWVSSGWQRPAMGLELNFFRRIPGSLFIAALTAPVSVPFEYARIAYYADKTYPEHLQKGYKSYFNALRRIPFEEGPYYLFKGCAPFLARNFLQTGTLFYSYDYLKDKVIVATREFGQPYFMVKAFCASVAVFTACLISNPFYSLPREMVELSPIHEGKHMVDNNYRKALVKIWQTDHIGNWLYGFKSYSLNNAPWMFLTLMLGDSLGIFTYWYTEYMTGPGTNSHEDTYS